MTEPERRSADTAVSKLGAGFPQRDFAGEPQKQCYRSLAIIGVHSKAHNMIL